MESKKKKFVRGFADQKWIPIDPSLSKYKDHPSFKEQSAKAKAMFMKTGIPEEFLKNRS